MGILLAHSDGCSVYQFQNETGDGTMTCYEIFPGAMLVFNDFHMEYFDSEYVPGGNMFAIDHCREGKMEYLAAEKIRIPYFKVKVMELLLYLDALELPQNPEERPYYYRTQIEKVKAMQRFLAEHMAENHTQEELSRQFEIPQTAMKSCFRAVYGTTIGAWLTDYRMNRAAELLRTEKQKNVAEIAGLVGYDSASKFAIAFKKIMLWECRLRSPGDFCGKEKWRLKNERKEAKLDGNFIGVCRKI